MWMPPVSRYMTPLPYTIGPRDTLAAARALMLEHQIRHLPVVDEDRLVGIISDRDLASIASDGRVADAMTSDVASVRENSPLDEVVNLMDAAKFGSVLILGDHGVVGIFTLLDALRAFAELLRRVEAGER